MRPYSEAVKADVRRLMGPPHYQSVAMTNCSHRAQVYEQARHAIRAVGVATFAAGVNLRWSGSIRYYPKSLRKTLLNGRAFPSGELLAARSGSFSANQQLRKTEFRHFVPLGLPDRCRLVTPLGNHLFMQPPSPV